VANHIVAIDFSDTEARVVVLESTLRQAPVTDILTIEPDGPEPVSEDTVVDGNGEAPAPEDEHDRFLAKIRAQLPQDIDALVVNADATATSSRLLSFPFRDVRKVEQALEFELEGQIPYNLEDVTTTWSITNRGAQNTDVLCATMPRDRLASTLAHLELADLEPRSVVVPAAALAELVPVVETEAPVAVLSLGGSQTHLAILHDGLHFARTLRFGTQNIDRALAKRFALSLEKAKHARLHEARILSADRQVSDDSRAVSDVLISALASLIASLSATFKSLPESALPQKILLTGELSRLSGLADYFSERFGIDVELLDIKPAIAPVGCRRNVGPEYAVAMGLALAAVKRGRGVSMNFRRGDFAYSGDLQRYRGDIIRIGTGVAIVFILALIGSAVRYSIITGEEARIDQAFCAATKKIVGREICDPTAALATMRQSPGAAMGTNIPRSLRLGFLCGRVC